MEEENASAFSIVGYGRAGGLRSSPRHGNRSNSESGRRQTNPLFGTVIQSQRPPYFWYSSTQHRSPAASRSGSWRRGGSYFATAAAIACFLWSAALLIAFLTQSGSLALSGWRLSSPLQACFATVSIRLSSSITPADLVRSRSA